MQFVSNSTVPFIILLLFSLRMAVWVDRVKTTRFCTWFVLEYNCHTYCITKKHQRGIKNEQKQNSRYLLPNLLPTLYVAWPQLFI